MNRYIIFLTAAALLFSFSTFAQTESPHHLLSKHHKKAQDDNSNVALHKTEKAEFRRKEALASGMSIADARATHRDMISKETTSKSKVRKEHHKALSKHHSKAAKHNQELAKELSKPSPDEQKVQEHIEGVKRSLDQAEQDNQALGESK
ncbi:MAG: hypothetical protein JWO58_436 [Chitinophagaceae bacterium]|nr:hypothetical protein [Chitinophagaceae bacterium]